MRFLMSALLMFVLASCCMPAGGAKNKGKLPNADGARQTPEAYKPPEGWDDAGFWADNGMIRVHAMDGITWFDVFHPKDKRWYVSKNNLNITTIVNGKQEGTENDKVQPEVELLSKSKDKVQLLFKYSFKNGAKIDATMTMRTGEPEVHYKVNKGKGSKDIDYFIWLVTFGQHEAVQRIRWKDNLVDASKLKTPLPGGRLKQQKVVKYDDIHVLDFHFEGDETKEPDPANPEWMSRVLGLDQHLRWDKPLRKGDQFAFEARDQPWQEHWDMPKVTPWIEALWMIRKGFLEGDEMVYRIDNLWPNDGGKGGGGKGGGGKGGGDQKKRKGKAKQGR